MKEPPPITLERIERALRIVAYIVARDDGGEVYAPILDRLEAERDALRLAASPRERARRILMRDTLASDRLRRIGAIAPS